jgi:hypothetical protein
MLAFRAPIHPGWKNRLPAVTTNDHHQSRTIAKNKSRWYYATATSKVKRTIVGQAKPESAGTFSFGR